jgi:hypothetical protein
MPISPTVAHTGVTPRRGELFPTLSGQAPDGSKRSTRDFYMRSNLAIIVLRDDEAADDWVMRANGVRDGAHAQAGEILIVAPPGFDPGHLPAIVDEGSLVQRLGIGQRTAPALFVLDRYGMLFATNTGDTATPDLAPEDIPNWLEFIACRCS